MTPSPTPTAASGASALSIAALVVGIVSLCIPGLLCIGVPLGIFAIVRAQDGNSRGFAIAGLVTSVLGIFTVGIVAAIAIPNFIKFGSRSRQAECKTVLRGAYTSARAEFAERDSYSLDPALLLGPDPHRRYAYVLGPKAEHFVAPTHPEAKGLEADEVRARVSALVPTGLFGRCPGCAVTFACAGNVDSDPDLDVWSISTETRTARGGRMVPAGEVFHHYDDSTDRDEGPLGPPAVKAAAAPPSAPTPGAQGTDPAGEAAPRAFKDLPLAGFEPSPELQRFFDTHHLKTTKDVLAVDPAKVPADVRDELGEFMDLAGATWGH